MLFQWILVALHSAGQRRGGTLEWPSGNGNRTPASREADDDNVELDFGHVVQCAEFIPSGGREWLSGREGSRRICNWIWLRSIQTLPSSSSLIEKNLFFFFYREGDNSRAHGIQQWQRKRERKKSPPLAASICTKDKEGWPMAVILFVSNALYIPQIDTQAGVISHFRFPY